MQSQLCAVHYTWSTSLPISLGRRPVFFFDISPSSSKKKSSATLCFPPSHRQLIKLAFQKERCRRGELNSIFHLAFLFFLFCRASGANGITREKVYGDGRRSSPRRGRNGPIGSLLSPVNRFVSAAEFHNGLEGNEAHATHGVAISISLREPPTRRTTTSRRVARPLCHTHTLRDSAPSITKLSPGIKLPGCCCLFLLPYSAALSSSSSSSARLSLFFLLLTAETADEAAN